MEEACVVDNYRLGDCEVCSGQPAKYTCPRCELKTCCLECTKIHKKELECNGDRDKTGYVPLKKFSNLTLLSDYRLLEDVTRVIDNCQRNPLKKSTRFNRSLPPHLFKLKSQALKRKTQLQFLPQHFTRHKENTTYLHFATNIIYWKLELIFPHADNLKIIIDRCCENEKLSKILSQFINFETCPDIYKNYLKYYHSLGLPGLEVLLKAENIKPSPSFFVLDQSLSLKENLEDKIIIENPVLSVVFKTHKQEFCILDDDLKWEFSDNNKGKNFPNFTPFSYFDTISYTRKDRNNESEATAASIHANAKELRKYFACNENLSDIGDDDDDDDDDDEEGSSETKADNSKKTFNIPEYKDLIKQ